LASETSASGSATSATASAATATTQASNAFTSATTATTQAVISGNYAVASAAYATYAISTAYNISSNSDFGSVTDLGTAAFPDETINNLLTMARGSNTYNYGDLL
jgi:hypothetical protein